MTFQPKFMLDLDNFKKERSGVKTEEDWYAFDKKWFDEDSWPLLSGTKLSDRSAAQIDRPIIDGETWDKTLFLYDISNEARYEYFYSILVVRNGILESLTGQTVDRSDKSWSKRCPFDEIETFDLNKELCPLCKRRLLYWQGE